MKRYWLFFVLIIFNFITVFGQSKYVVKIDSLKKVLLENISDSSKIKVYRELCWNYAGIRSELETSRKYADSMKMLSKKTQNKEGLINSHLCYGMINRYEANYSKALKHLNTYVKYYKENKKTAMEAEGWFQIAIVNQWLGNYDESMSAYEYILKIHEENENWNGMVATLNGIGIVYRRSENFKKAIEVYKRAISINNNHNLGRDLTYVLINLGNCYSALEQYDMALKKYKISLKISQENNNEYGIAANLANIANVYKNKNMLELAIDSHFRALKIRERLPQKRSYLISLIDLGETYVKLENYKPAQQYLTEAVLLAKKINAKPQLSRAYHYLTKLYEVKKEYQKAYEYGQLTKIVQDSIFNESKTKQITELQTKYETAEKDKEIALLSKENELQQATVARQETLKNGLILGLVLLTVIAGLVFYTLRQRLKNQKLLATKNEEIKTFYVKEQMQTLEMKALRAQMNPNFLFNSLNSINTMILSDDNENASRYLSKFSKLVRLMLENSEQPKVSLKDEINMLEAYIQLESLRFSNKIDYKINVDQSINKESTYLPSMVLQPFVENAIWHGLLHKEERGLLIIDIKEEDEHLQCSIIDNGIGRERSLKFKKEDGLKKKSMGIKITSDRLKLLTKQKINDVIHIIDLKDDKNNSLGTQVDIQIPIS